MLKRFSVLSILVLILLNSCTDTVEPDYINKFDPKCSDYTPTAAAYLSIRFSDSPLGFEIKWTDKSLGEIGFEIERRDTHHPDYLTVGSVPPNTTTFLDSFVPELNIYYLYRIKAVTENGNSSYSDVANYYAAIFLGPTALIIEHQNNNSVILYWVNRTSLADSFDIKMRQPNIQGSNFETIGTVGKDIDQFLVKNLDTTKAYELKVTAFNTYYQADSQTTVYVVFSPYFLIRKQENNYIGCWMTQFSKIRNLKTGSITN